jgi:hypothetical protein
MGSICNRYLVVGVLVGLMPVFAQAAPVIVDDFSSGSVTKDSLRVYETDIDEGWQADQQSAWTIAGGMLKNSDTATSGIAGEGAVAQVVKVTGHSGRYLDLSFDYTGNAYNLITVHLWGYTGSFDGDEDWFADFQVQNGGYYNYWNGPSTIGEVHGYSLKDGSDAVDPAPMVSLSGSGAYSNRIDLQTLGIPGVTNLSNLSYISLAFGRKNYSGATNTTVDAVNLSAWPIFDAEPLSGPIPHTVVFDASPGSNAGDFVLFEWDFGDGISATGIQVAHTYSNAGIYKAELTITDAGGQVLRSSTGVDAFVGPFHIDEPLLLVLETVGFDPLVLTNGVVLEAGGSVEVDGSAYEGFDGYFPLMLCTNLPGSITNVVTFTGFGERAPAVVLQSDGLWLRLIAPPGLSERLCSLVPPSRVAPVWSNTVFSAAREYDPSGSAWSLTFDEAHVLDTTLKQTVLDSPVRSWELRTGRGGFIYSLRTPLLGETVPPSWRSDGDTSPWNDEVWQGVAVGPLNDPPESRYFMHQSGVYMRDPVLTEPFYSPQVAAHMDAADRSFTTVNWTPHAHINVYTDENPDNDWKSYLLMYTRYRDLGQGVIEVTLGCYNYGPDYLNWFNMPWGGVRRTGTEYAFVSDPGGTAWSEPVTDLWGTVVDFDETGGWMGYSATTNGSTPSMAFVFGRDARKLLPDQIKKSWFRWGYAGGTPTGNETDWRNYFVTTAIRHYDLTQGKGFWSRFYFALGDDMQDLSDRIANRELVDADLAAFDYSEASTPLAGYSVSGSGAGFRIIENSISPQFFLYAHPVSGSFPVFEIIKNDQSRYLTWNPYADGIIKPYDGTIAGLRLLGFAMPAAGSAGTYAALAGYLPPENYRADGETLYVRTATPREAWRVKYFGLTANAGDGADTANPDDDTAVNLWEYGCGGNPTNAADIGHAPTLGALNTGGSSFVAYTYARRLTQDLDYRLESCSNLLSNDWAGSVYTELPEVGTIDSDFEAVTNHMDTAGRSNEFIRLVIEAL